MIKIRPYIIFQVTLLILSLLFCLLINISVSKAAIGDYTIVCGTTAKGQPVNCDTSTHRCIKCEHHSSPRGYRWISDRVTYNFTCINKANKIPRNCETSNAGGLKGESHTSILLFKVAKDEGIECVTNNFIAMYSSTCYSCEIVETLASAFVKAAAKAYDVSRQAGNAILVVGLIIWIAIYVFKNVTAFTTVEPRQMIQGLLVQFFKVFVAYAIINSGIQTILHYTLEPIMLMGTDFADAIMVEAAPDGEI